MPQAHYLYSELSSAIEAYKNAQATNTPEWVDKWEERILMLQSLLPSGSGFDSGTKVDMSLSHADKIVLETSFHHMDEHGYYDGWTEHTVTITPSLSRDFHLRISGRNRNDIKEMMYQDFDYCLRQDITYELYREEFPQYQITTKSENQDGSPSQCYFCYYVGAERFWNNLQAAKDRASQLMLDARYTR